MRTANQNVLLLLGFLGLVWLCLFFLIGCIPEPDPPSADEYQPAVAVAIGIAHRGTSKPDTPDTPDDNEICSNCGGTGRLGDGTVFVDCPMCDGPATTPAGGAAISQETPPSFAPPALLEPEIEEKGHESQVIEEAEAPKPKLLLRVGDGEWCEPCIRLLAAIEANHKGLRDTLNDDFDYSVEEVPKDGKYKVPMFHAENGEKYGGYRNGPEHLVRWLKTQKRKEK